MNKILTIIMLATLLSACKKERCVKCEDGRTMCHDAKDFDMWRNGFISQFKCEEIP